MIEPQSAQLHLFEDLTSKQVAESPVIAPPEEYHTTVRNPDGGMLVTRLRFPGCFNQLPIAANQVEQP